ncbi:hypothetical protein [Sodalis praecaptivus]|nr:hypothetical protein [Sodalis praecaptivus]
MGDLGDLGDFGGLGEFGDFGDFGDFGGLVDAILLCDVKQKGLSNSTPGL